MPGQIRRLFAGVFAAAICFLAACANAETVLWKDCLKQSPAWYASAEALRVGDNLLLYQRDTGGWPKNEEMAAVLGEEEKANLRRDKARTDSTIDNDATYTQAIFLARIFNATQQERFKESFLKAVDYLLAAQYENGGWPQFYPLRHNYSTHITFNDDAMIGAMELLRDIAKQKPSYTFVDEARRVKAQQAVDKGIACILKCQVIVDDKRTVWCQQHDEKTFQPAPARSYEKISLCGGESVNIVRFLMRLDAPTPEQIEAIQSAVDWFEKVKITGIRVIEKPDPTLPKGFDKVVVEDANAPPTWARFYEIGTNRPIFCGRDGIIKYRLADIEHERRVGYAWYTKRAANLLAQDYPAWRKKLHLQDQ